MREREKFKNNDNNQKSKNFQKKRHKQMRNNRRRKKNTHLTTTMAIQRMNDDAFDKDKNFNNSRAPALRMNGI